MGISLTEFKSKVQDVARPNRFLLNLAAPTGGADSETLSYICKGAQTPSRTIGEIVLSWQGMQAKIAGDPTFEPITLTFLDDYEQKARKTFEAWMKAITDQTSNEREAQIDYKTDVTLHLLGRKAGEIIGTFKLFGVWPTTMDASELNMESPDTAQEFTVTLNLDYWEREA